MLTETHRSATTCGECGRPLPADPAIGPSGDHGPFAASLASAAQQAQAAAGAAGVRIETIEDPERLLAVSRLLAEVWATPPGHDPLAPDVLRSLAHAGGAVHVAFGPGGMTGATAAIFGPPRGHDLYSLIAGAKQGGRGVGYALKLAQRSWALERGVATISWTFDPLVRRNAWFNLVKLGAHATEYTPDFYGPLDDGFNTGDKTDRLTAVWHLDRLGTPAADIADRPDPDTSPGPDGLPFTARDERSLWCRVPEDIVAVRGADPARAVAWRTAVQDVLAPALADGYAATSMTRDGWYRLTRP
ncbi:MULTISPECIES: chorismate synthase [unclassified Streptomyces]|uniref:chorismate synthase n=1 Tax=unclassified Streptomyces TaxID=2593676 RepID=UPI002E815827|nr:chorismate synthase [Streptomyces sp. NBC_00589]WTI35683.1 chorismate synthase [Streptomyces sp. NBC_00775]WUB30643.1 chorismate synthase [Streptomyces sp. NBC_00589]